MRLFNHHYFPGAQGSHKIQHCPNHSGNKQKECPGSLFHLLRPELLKGRLSGKPTGPGGRRRAAGSGPGPKESPVGLAGLAGLLAGTAASPAMREKSPAPPEGRGESGPSDPGTGTADETRGC